MNGLIISNQADEFAVLLLILLAVKQKNNLNIDEVSAVAMTVDGLLKEEDYGKALLEFEEFRGTQWVSSCYETVDRK